MMATNAITIGYRRGSGTLDMTNELKPSSAKKRKAESPSCQDGNPVRSSFVRGCQWEMPGVAGLLDVFSAVKSLKNHTCKQKRLYLTCLAGRF